MSNNFLVLVFYFLALLVFALGLFSAAIPNPVLLGLALVVVGFIVGRLGGDVNRP